MKSLARRGNYGCLTDMQDGMSIVDRLVKQACVGLNCKYSKIISKNYIYMT